MKNRFLNVLKWFFIALGVLFFAQLLLFIAIIIFANTFRVDRVSDIDIRPQKYNLKEMQKIIDYAKDYKDENGKYPKTVDNIELNKNFEYKYSTSNDDNCYTIDLKNIKTNATKKYSYCDIKKDGSSSVSESFTEVK